MTKVFAMKTPQGALPTLYAATAPDLEGGSYYGPHGFFEMSGYPAPAKIMPEGRDPDVAAKLWDTSETLTGVTFSV